MLLRVPIMQVRVSIMLLRAFRYARGMVSAERFAARQSKEFCIWTITSAQIMATAASSTVAGDANAARFSVQRATRSVGHSFFLRRRHRR